MTSLWDLEEDKRKEIEKAGVDYNLSACLSYNPQPFDLLDIKKVLAVWEGEHDEDDWRWIIQLTPFAAKKIGQKFVFLQGGCDYTGWDCQSWAKCSFATTAKKAAMYAITGPNGRYMSNSNTVYEKLMEQLGYKKTETWREKKDKELGVSKIPKIKR